MQIIEFLKLLIRFMLGIKKIMSVESRLNMIIVALACILVVRAMLFLSTQDVGLEHDSSWYIGAAQSLAEKGKYASYLNSVVDVRLGANPTIEGRWAVQDAEGLNYFPAGITVGPLYVLPQSILFRIFGTGYWQYRLWPLLGYFLVLVVMFKIVDRFGGASSVFMLSVILWARPQFFFNLSYEAFSEHIALLFLLLSITSIHDANGHKTKYALGGIFLAFSCMTKFVFFMSVPVFLIYFIDDIKKYRISKRFFSRWVIFAFFFFIPYLAFETYRFLYLYSNFGVEAFFAINRDIVSVIDSGGSGISNVKNLFAFIIPFGRSSIWMELGIGQIIGFMSVLMMFIWSANNISKNRKLFCSLLLVSSLNILWFIFLAKNFWFRHVWYGMMIYTLLLISVIPQVWKKAVHSRSSTLIAVTLITVYLSILSSNAYISPVIDKEAMNSDWKKWLDNMTVSHAQGPVFAPVTSWSQQVQASDFVRNKITKSSFIVYHSFMNATELSVHTRRVHYPVSRIANDKRMNENNTYFIIGPYQKGFANIFETDNELKLIDNYCDEILFDNPSYTICKIKPKLIDTIRL